MNLDAEQALEDRTMQLFAELGWQTANAFYEACAPDKATAARPYLGRRDEAEVLLRDRVMDALARLNPELPPAAHQAAYEVLAQGRGAMSPVEANRAVYRLLKDGIPVAYRDADSVEQHAKARIIDWRDVANNDFLMVQQLWVQGALYRRRADLIGFVNGIPLLFGELKAHHRKLINAYRDNLRDYKTTIPHLFWYTSFMVLSNGSRAVLGNLSAPFRHFGTWKRVADEHEQGIIALETLVRAACVPARLLDLVENYTLYYAGQQGLEKITAKNHQYLGVENVLRAVEHIRENQGKLGVFWHTQGSGKSFSMILFSQKLLRTRGGHWTFVIVTDRKDLDSQIYKNFARCGVVTEDEKRIRAQSGEHLKQLLREDHRYVFTLIHKFHSRDGGKYPVLSERDDIIVITDEAHRRQYAELAMNLRRALPDAAFIGFTGTPLMADEIELTRQVFGDYVSIYDFRQSVADGATVPLYYENRVPEVQLTNAQLNTDMAAILEQSDVNDETEAQLARRFVKEYQVITRDDRLDKVAADIVEHFIHRGYRGKAMVISIDKLTTVKMYDKVRRHWQRTLDVLRIQRQSAPPVAQTELDDLIAYMEGTDMAVVLSQGQNEIALFQEHGLDIRPHRERMVKEDLDEKFKDPDDPFSLVFVCAMWRTGFDAPACSTLYLDRPMRNHTLMQTIARANRVYGDKHNGLIVDYIGIFRELQQALAIYATGTEGDYPIQDKAALVADLEEALAEAEAFCMERGVDLDALRDGVDAFEHIAQLDAAAAALVDAQTEAAADDAVEALVVNDELLTRFLNLVAQVSRLYRAILPDSRAAEFTARQRLLGYLARKLHALLPDPADAPDVYAEVTQLLDDSIEARRYVIREPRAPYDLSRIDFDALRARFERGRKRTEAAKLRGALNAKLRRMVRRNSSRMDYQQSFEALVAAYNEDSRNIEAFFEQLLALTQELAHEEQRHIRENLTEAELAVFDILTRLDLHLTPEEARQVKQVSRVLLRTLEREKLVLDWRKRQQTRASVKMTIEDALYSGLPERYPPELYAQKRDDLYRHIYERYADAEHNIYAAG
ncbi:MAG: type I restriction endonuclease subunit R [Anaerolineae bacterium]|nr:type I restriction endonuclease subunit R [Anaerolineae bacterium]